MTQRHLLRRPGQSLRQVARRYRLTFVPDRPLELEAHINLRTKHPLMMKLERRQ